MKNKLRWITETAVMLALLLSMQWVGSMIPDQMLKQLVTGSLVNCVLAVTALYVGYTSGCTVALLSPIFAFSLGIAPNVLTVVPIMVGNVCYVVLLRLIAGKSGRPFMRQVFAWVVAAGVKFAVLYVLVTEVICGVLADELMAAGTLKAPMLQALPSTFGAIQMVTALLGGGLALAVMPALRKARRK